MINLQRGLDPQCYLIVTGCAAVTVSDCPLSLPAQLPGPWPVQLSGCFYGKLYSKTAWQQGLISEKHTQTQTKMISLLVQPVWVWQYNDTGLMWTFVTIRTLLTRTRCKTHCEQITLYDVQSDFVKTLNKRHKKRPSGRWEKPQADLPCSHLLSLYNSWGHCPTVSHVWSSFWTRSPLRLSWCVWYCAEHPHFRWGSMLP